MRNVALLAITMLSTAPLASRADAEDVRLTRCVVTLVDEVEIPTVEPGVITSIAVREGTKVKAGDLIAAIDDTDARAKLTIAEAELRVAQEQAASDVRVQAAQAEAEVTETEFLRGSNTLTGTNDDSQKKLKRLLLSPRRAKLQTEVAKHDLEIAKLNSQVRAAQLAAAKSRLERHRIVAPHGGVVVQRYHNVGEWMAPGEAILRIVRMDKLRVEGFVSSDDFAPTEVLDQPVSITVNLPRGKEVQLTGKITYASPIVEADGKYRVWTDIENREMSGQWIIRPGLTADMTIKIE